MIGSGVPRQQQQVAIIYGVGPSTLYRKFPAASRSEPGGADREDKSPAIIIEAWTAGESRRQCVYICVLKNELITKIKA
ncbi:hypothetical protein EQG29_21070 [Salmonella enterica subsp. enterica serovar Chichester]|nr:hypothetical protein [Salmonella enterica subsp. enterica serovar Chichester]